MSTKPPSVFTRQVIGWTLYDWANSAFACSVLGVFFPVFFRDYWNGESVPSGEITWRLGAASAIASLVIVVLAPVLGSIADRGSAKKKFLFVFAALGIVMTGSLFFIAKGDWLPAAALYVFASLGFMGGNIFYDAMIVGVAPKGRADLVSGLGFGFGYLGGGLLLAGHFWLVQNPEVLGLTPASAVRWALVSVAVWWALFSIPLFLFVKEPVLEAPPEGSKIAAGIRDLIQTFGALKQLKQTALFLVAYWFYIDGVDTVIRMAADYASTIEGIERADLLKAFLLTQFIGFPAAILFGKLGERIGPKTGVYIGIVSYIGICTYGYFVTTPTDFYIIAVSVGLVQGGIQSLSRSLFTRLVPPTRTAEFFGFYNMLGKSAAILGPIMMGWVAMATDNPRLSILSIIILFVIGAAVFSKVNIRAGHEAALAYDTDEPG